MPVKSPICLFGMAGKLFYAIFVSEMKKITVIAYWVVSILLVSVILVSLGYRFLESLFIATMFLPGALAAKFFISKVSFKNRKAGIKNVIFIVLGIIAAEILLFMLSHYYIMKLRAEHNHIYDIPELVTNPVFIAIILAILAAGSYFFELWLDRKYPTGPTPITFTSDRKAVSLLADEILYVESNDNITIVYATGNRSFRNITPISQWESILRPYFIRIHRSYLVNKAVITRMDVDLLYIGDIELPVSRKYKDSVREYLNA